jgi:HAD superfamily hydrolase (TIGR01484 family)
MDMDRTALPNGDQEESPEARERLRRVASHSEVTIAYVSGRRKELQIEAIEEFDLPQPTFGVADVGTSIYEVTGGEWSALQDWKEEISRSWQGRTADAIRKLLHDREDLQLQEPEAQGEYKLSYFAAPDLDHGRVIQEIQDKLRPAAVKSSVIWSVDETTGTGLLDILPERATKLHAVKFLMKRVGVDERRMVYAGDSGNDLPVLTSGLQAVLVANAIPEVRDQAVTEIQNRGCPERLYVARGGFLGMNGNYAAGILEGLAHFAPKTRSWME